jgi:hypothetical protein
MGKRGNGVARYPVLAAAMALVGWAALLMSTQARAQFYVTSPDVEQGETELEEHGAIYAGPTKEEDLHQSHELVFRDGLTGRAQLIVEGSFEQPLGESLQATEFEIGGQYQLVKPQGDGFAFAFQALYEAARDAPDGILFGPLVSFRKGRNSTTLNTFFVGQVGNHPEIDGLEFEYNWQLKHEINNRFAFGVEAFGDIEDLANPGSFNDQFHRTGPVVYLNFGKQAKGSDNDEHNNGGPEHDKESEAPKFEIAAGVLFGLTEATSNVTFKVDAELEF